MRRDTASDPRNQDISFGFGFASWVTAWSRSWVHGQAAGSLHYYYLLLIIIIIYCHLFVFIWSWHSTDKAKFPRELPEALEQRVI